MSLPPPPRQFKNITYHSNFSQHLRVSRITRSKNLLYDTEKAFRKYYGKKVTKLLHEEEPSSLCSANRYKALKSFKARVRVRSVSVMDRCPSKTIRHLDLHSTFFFNPKKKSLGEIRKMTQYKHLESLRMTPPLKFVLDTSFYKNIRKFNHIQSLDLTLTEKLLIDNSKYFFRLKSLKEIKLYFIETEMKLGDINEALKFFGKLLDSKHLQTVCLDLDHFDSASSFLNPLLRHIEQTSLPSFNISLRSKNEDLINTEYLDAALNKIDLFKFDSFVFNTKQSQNVSLDQAKRILNLSIRFRAERENMSFITSPASNTLITDLNESFAKLFGSSIPLIPNISNITALKKLSLDLGMTKSSTPIEKELVHVLKKATALEHFILSDFRDPVLDRYEVLVPEIQNLKNLTYFDIFVQSLTPKTLLLILQPVAYLDNLKRFRFRYSYPSILDLSKIDFTITFSEKSKLTELDFKLPHLNSASKINFIATISKLPDLQKIHINEGPQLWFEQESRTLLMNTLLSLTQLREVSIEEAEMGPGMPGLSMAQTQENEKAAAELRDYTERIFQENRNIEGIYLQNRLWYLIDYKRY